MSKPSALLSEGPRRRLAVVVLIAIVAAALFQLADQARQGTWRMLSNQTSDSFLRLQYGLFGPRPINAKVWGIAVGDSDLEAAGKTNLDRELYAKLINRLADIGVSGVLIDTLFALDPQPANDKKLADAFSKTNAVWLAVAPQTLQGAQTVDGVLQISKLRLPQKDFQVPSVRFGHVLVQPDQDGVYRSFYPVLADGSSKAALLGLQAGTDILKDGADAEDPNGGAFAKRLVPNSEGKLPLSNGRQWSDISGSLVTLTDLLSEDPDKSSTVRDTLERKIVVVFDATASGKDYGTTNYESAVPLGTLHLAMLSDVLDKTFPVWSPWWFTLVLQALIAIGLILGWRARSWPAVTAFTVGGLVLTLAGQLFLANWQYLIPNPLPWIGFGLVLAIGLFAERTVREYKERQLHQARLGRFFAPALLKKIVADHDPLDRIERKVLSVMFTDIKGFTQWSANREPEQVRSVLNTYFERMTGIVFENGGTVDKYIGDGLLAFFGDPIDQSDDAARALRSALEMQKAATELRTAFLPQAGLDLQIRIGINRGEMIVGGLGAKNLIQYTVLGSQVNMAQRLESQATPGHVLVSASLFAATGLKMLADGSAPDKSNGSTEPVLKADFDGQPVSCEKRTVKLKGFEDMAECVEVGHDGAPST